LKGYSSFIGAFSNGAWKKVTVGESLSLLGEAVKIGGKFIILTFRLKAHLIKVSF
jgi:hypothetical protein